MIARGFKSVLWVGAVGSAALGCYMVSLRVATERADLTRVEHQIVEAKRDIRSLQTELGTRGRLAQLEDWNTNVLALSAPGSSQFVKDGYALARLQTREPAVEDRTGAVRMASLETGQTVTEAKPASPVPPRAAAAVDKPARPAPAAPAPEASPVPHVVQALAAAPASRAPLVRRASFTPAEASAAPAPAAAKPSKPKPASATKPIRTADLAPAKPVPAKKVKIAVRPSEMKPSDIKASPKHEPRPALRTAARTDKPVPAKPGKPHGTAKLAAADGAARPASSGHRGGAQ